MDIEIIRKIVGRLTKKQAVNALSVVNVLNRYGSNVGLNQPHRAVQFLAQMLHESGAFNYDRELWGPTAQQKKYEPGTQLAKRLGNTQRGDGSKFKGRGPFQLTGRDNYVRFTEWARELDPNTPDFSKQPELINTDPWEGLSALWYWDVGNPERKSLNRYADQGDIEMITKRINGGLNGYQDRLNWYTRAALVMLGYGRDDVTSFQHDHGLTPVDGISGPKTRAILHTTLAALSAPIHNEPVRSAPVVVETVPETVDKAVKNQTNGWGWSGIGVGGAGAALTAVAGWPWQTIALFAGLAVAGGLVALVIGPWIIRRVRVIRQEVRS